MLLLFSICSVITVAFGQLLTPEVTITQGKVIGSVASDGSYYEFHGIPYADSTSGINRFKAPLPAPKFQDDFVANRKDIKCVRGLGVGYEGTEDCLVANVFTQSITSTSQLPVMVWIKGKEFDKTHEEDDLSFKNFVEKGIVVVSLNYRESVLGFLCLGTQNAPGNAGLKDIIAGLRWVQENIAQFGGNPNDVTLFGHGSGGAAVDLVTLSPMADGLVHKAIAQSGNAMAPWAVSRDNLKYAIQVAEGLGHVITDIQELSDVFTRTSVAALMGIINELELTDNSLAFAPCVEKSDLADVEPFLTRTPKEIIDADAFLKIPFITGFVDNEGTIRADEAINDDWLTRMQNSFTDFLQPDLKFTSNTDESRVAQQIRSYYFGEDNINLLNIDRYIRYHGHTMMMISGIREVRNRAARSAAPTYLYQFSYRGLLGTEIDANIDIDSAAHSDELAYLFYTGTAAVPNQVTVRDLAIRDILVERWTNFVRTGEPSSTTSEILWRPFTGTTSFFLHVLPNDDIGTSSALESSLQQPHANAVFFWEGIYSTHFLDAESSWDIIDRNEEEPTTAAPTTAAPEVTTAGGAGGDVTTAGSADDATTTEAPSSASTAVGCTLLIVTLFTLLNHLHSSQLLS